MLLTHLETSEFSCTGIWFACFSFSNLSSGFLIFTVRGKIILKMPPNIQTYTPKAHLSCYVFGKPEE